VLTKTGTVQKHLCYLEATTRATRPEGRPGSREKDQFLAPDAAGKGEKRVGGVDDHAGSGKDKSKTSIGNQRRENQQKVRSLVEKSGPEKK